MVSCSHDDIIKDNNEIDDRIYTTRLVDCSIIVDGNEYNTFDISDSIIRVQVPNSVDLSNVKLNYKHEGKSITITRKDGKETTKPTVDLSDFTDPLRITIYSNTDSTKYTLMVYDLPVLVINTPDSCPIESREERVEGCTVRIFQDNQWEDYGTAGIKGRGHSTWVLPKKPYNIKLDKKCCVMGMAESKHWTLLANAYYDKTQLHNCVAFEIARKTDFSWVQSGKYVELILNGIDMGLYYLCEKTRVEKNRINIKDLKPTDLDESVITGGYLLETVNSLDGYKNAFYTDFFNKTGRGYAMNLGWTLESPDDEVPQAQFEYIKNALNHMESLIYNKEKLMTCEYMEYLDIESFINWKLVEDLCLNEESMRSKNISIYKNRGDNRFYMAPPWDFDAWSFGCLSHDLIYTNNFTIYYYKLLTEPNFVARLKDKWQAYKNVWKSEIPIYIEKTYQTIRRAALRNEEMWPEWNEIYDNISYDECVKNMMISYERQIDYMDSIIETY